MEVKVIYTGTVSVELDRALERCLRDFGLVRWASGYDVLVDKRDLAFDRGEGDTKQGGG